MIRVAIVEDAADYRLLIRAHLTRFQAEHDTEFVIDEFADGSEITANYTPRYDIVFLDVQMDQMDGFTTARIIRETDPRVIIIFITQAPQFAIKGYEVDALSYLLKPVSYFAFAQEMCRSLARLERNRDDYIMLSTAGELQRVAVADITYVESIKHRLEVNTVTGQLGVFGTLKQMAEKLEPLGFHRINSGYLINLRHVLSVSGTDAILTGNVPLTISRARRKGFLEALADYFGGRTS